MHERQSEDTQHMWAALSQRPALGTLAESIALELFSKGGRKIRIGDTALFQAGNAPPFIGILRKVCTDKEGLVKLGVNWLYRPADLNLARGVSVEAAPNEIFYSFHKDDISAASLLHPCKVAFLGKGVELPTGVSSFVCRRVYDTANKCLWWLTDRDYTDEHQEEVDNLLARTKLEMQAAVQTGGPSARPLAGAPASQQLKSGPEALNASVVCPAPCKGKKRERVDQNLDPSKRERAVKPDDNDSAITKHDRNMKPEDIASITDKDGGFFNFMGVDRLVQLMQQERVENIRKCGDTASRRSMLAGVIAASERDDCLNRFVQQGGLTLLDDWLQEAQRGVNGDGVSPKEGGKVLEELLLVLLQALDRLPVNLEALKTCIVGKSVNHLRTHKNPEIQKRARKLVDVWKKRVDAEMKLTGEGKSGSSHGISWSCKQPSPDSVPTHQIKSGPPSEVAVKSSGAFAGNVKAVMNCCTLAESRGNVSVSGNKYSGLPGLAPMKDGPSKVSANCLNDVHAAMPKEEKNSGSSLNQINVQGWTNVLGKGSGWKEEGRSFISAPSNPMLLVSGPRSQNVSSKGLLASGLLGAQKEVTAGKPLVWSRNSSSDKACNLSPSTEKVTVDICRGEGSPAQGRLTVRIPNPGKGGLTGVSAIEASLTEASGRGPAAVVDRHNGIVCSASTSGDVPDGTGRVPSSIIAGGPTETCDERRAGTVGGSNEKAPGAKISDCENMVGESSLHGKSEGRLTSGISGVNETVFDYSESSPKNKLKGVDKLLRCQQPHLGDAGDDVDVDSSGMSLLATIAASEISSGESLHGIADVSLDNAGVPCSEIGASRGDLEKYCSGTNNQQEAVNDSVSTFQTLGTDGARVCGMEIVSAKCLRDRAESNDLEIKGIKIKSGTDDSLEPLPLQQVMNSNVGEESSAIPLDVKMPLLEGDPIVGVGSFTQSPEGHGDLRLVIGVENSRCSVSGETGPIEDRIAPSGHVVGNQDLHSASGKAGRWETVVEEKKQCVMLSKNGKRGDHKAVACVSSEGSPFEDDALQVAQQVGQEAEQEVKRFGKPACNVSVDMHYADNQTMEVARVDNDSLVLAGANGDECWKPSCEANSTGQCKKTSGAQHQCPTQNAPYSDDSQETVTERREDVDAGGTKGFVEGDEVDQDASVEACNEESITSAPADTSLPPDGTKEEDKAGNVSGRLTVSVSDQTGALPNLVQNIIKPGQQTLQAGEPTTPEQATEVLGPSDGPVGGSDASERPDFDLNEGIVLDENPLNDGSTTPVSGLSPLALVPHSVVTNLTTPIAVVATMKGAFIPPASPLRLKGELGWKGSAATSAFRPAEPRRTPDRQQSASEAVAADPAPEAASKQMRPPLDIDLNVVDERGLDDAGPLPQLPYPQQQMVGLVLEDMSYPQRSLVKLDLDLNRADEGEESGTLLVAEAKGSQALGSSTETEFSASRSVIRDFDLNDGPASDDYFSADDAAFFTGVSNVTVPPPASVMIGGLRLGGDIMNAPEWFGSSSSYSGRALPSFPSSRTESCYTVAVSGQYLSAGPVPTSFANDQYQTGRGAPGSAASLYPTSSPAAYSFSGHPPGSGFPDGCSVRLPSSSPPYVESAGSSSLTSSLSSQAGIPGVLTAAYVRPPYLPGAGDIPAQDVPSPWTRPSLDLNAGPELTEVDAREDHTTVRQPSSMNRQNLNDEQLKALRLGTVKRKEPEGGWEDSVKSGYARSSWNL